MSLLNVNKVDPSTGTALELGTSGDTITVPTGAGLTVVDEVKTNKVSPATGTAFALGDSGDTFTVPSGATIVNSGTATGFGITAASFSPLAQAVIINGDMAVSQRSTSVTGIDATENCQTVDRWSQWLSTAGTWTQTQEAMSVADYNTTGFKKAWKWDCTTANASLSAGSYFQISYRMEGNTVQMFKKGTTTAEAYTLAFWVKSTKTGTFIGELYDVTNERAISVAYTVDTTNTWEKKVLNFVADTNGETIDDSTDREFVIYFGVSVGTNFTSGTLNTAWNDDSGITANRYVGQVNCADSTSNNFHMTGVQLEVGTYTSSTIPPFQHESYADNLRRCQRYYQTFGKGVIGKCRSTSAGTVVMPFPVTMRATPTCTVITGANTIADPGVSDYQITSLGSNSSGFQGLFIAINTNGGTADGFYFGSVDKVGDVDAEFNF